MAAAGAGADFVEVAVVAAADFTPAAAESVAAVVARGLHLATLRHSALREHRREAAPDRTLDKLAPAAA